MTAITRLAPAKLNLTLRITGRRADGYHLLDSLIGFTEYGDTLTAVPADDLTLDLTGPFGGVLAGDPAENLVLRAARLLAAEAGVAPRAKLSLTKLLPVASGIGGGSSDAAATLSALSALWRVAPAKEDLARLALTLGADVPVCLYRRSARLRGIGEIVTPARRLPPAAIVLVNPGVALPTPKVFAARRGAFAEHGGPDDLAATDAAGLAAALAPHPDDLTEAAIGVEPAIALALTALSDTAGALLSRMSGSGATCFALFQTAETAAAAARAITAAHPGWWVIATQLRAA